MKVSLVNPPSPFLIDEKVFPPLGLLYVGAVLESEGMDVKIIDLAGVPPEKWLGKLEANEAEQSSKIWGITCTTPQFPFALSICDAIKRINNNAKVVVGGPHATVEPVSCIPHFDSVVIGEGEKAILNLVRNPGEYPESIQEALINDLDSIPFPARHLVDISSYHYSIDGRKVTNILTSRGCPYGCAFCCKTWGRQIRFRSPNNVLGEIKLLKEIYGFEGVMMYDDEFLINWSRDLKIFEGLHDLGMVWRCFTRANLLDEKKVKKMADCGCKEILIGIESGSDRILKNINKGTTREMNKRAINLLKKNGIRCKAALIIGLPGESLESIKETETFVEETQPDTADFSVLTVYPKSDIYEHPEKYDLNFPKISNVADKAYYKTKPGQYSANVSTSHLNGREIVEARERLDAKFKRI
jgi:anaerobic magnesium-protoporphyrin IX monomethyl ester cyclase